jgi:hypothetical protein
LKVESENRISIPQRLRQCVETDVCFGSNLQNLRIVHFIYRFFVVHSGSEVGKVSCSWVGIRSRFKFRNRMDVWVSCSIVRKMMSVGPSASFYMLRPLPKRYLTHS